MSAREKRKAEWLSSSLAKNAQEQLQKTLRKVLRMEPEQRGADQQALLSQHETLAAQLRQSLSASQQQKKAKAEHEKEFEDPPAVFDDKLRALADLIKRSSPRVVIHTGAGLSTPAGIPDFRGPQGVWTLQQKGQVAVMRMRYEDARPTKAHMVIAELVRRGIVSHVVSQNVDGLLLRAGVPADRLFELHGCVYTEVCPSCGRVYTRGYDVTATNGTAFRRHVTGRLCEAEVGDATLAGEGVFKEPLDERGMNDATSAEKGVFRQLVGERKLSDATSAEEGLLYESRDGRGLCNAASAEHDVLKEPLDERSSKRIREEGCDVTEGKGVLQGEGVPATSSKPSIAEGLGEQMSGRGSQENGTLEVDRKPSGTEVLHKSGAERLAPDEQTQTEATGEKFTGEDEEGRSEGAEVQRTEVREQGRPHKRASAAARRVCGGALRDTIVHFGERLDEEVLRTAREASAAADLAVTLGTSLKVPPASTLPGLASTAVIVNLQWTAKDKRAVIKINGRCEVVMERLAELLNLEAPEYKATEDPVLKMDAQKRGESNHDCKVEKLGDRETLIPRRQSKKKHKSRTRSAFPRPLH